MKCPAKLNGKLERTLIGSQQSAFEGKADYIGPAPETGFGRQVGAMGFDRPFRDLQLFRDLPIGVTVGEKSTNLPFSRCQEAEQASVGRFGGSIHSETTFLSRRSDSPNTRPMTR